jgi:hypothetical protein
MTRPFVRLQKGKPRNLQFLDVLLVVEPGRANLAHAGNRCEIEHLLFFEPHSISEVDRLSGFCLRLPAFEKVPRVEKSSKLCVEL